LTVTILFLWAVLSDDVRVCLLCMLLALTSRVFLGVRVPWDSWPYFTVLDSRLPLSSSPTTRGATVEVFDPASTRVIETQSQSHIVTDGRSICKSWCRAPSGAHDQIFITPRQLRSWFCGALSLTRGRVCLLYILLALASIVFLGSESLGTLDHILLSQIWDFSFRRLVRLAGSRWRYSNPPPQGCSWLRLKSKSKSKLCYDRRSVGQTVLMSSTHLGLMTKY
jgi:hypothetical protein